MGLKRSTGWTHVAFVESMTDPGKQYEIKKRDSNGQDGCDCKRYQFARGEKTCKHLRAYYAGESVVLAAEPVIQASMRQADMQTISFEGEAFTIRRRGIGGLDAMLAGGPVARQRAQTQAADWPEFELALRRGLGDAELSRMHDRAVCFGKESWSGARRKHKYAASDTSETAVLRNDIVECVGRIWREVHNG